MYGGRSGTNTDNSTSVATTNTQIHGICIKAQDLYITAHDLYRQIAADQVETLTNQRVLLLLILRYMKTIH